MQYKSIGRVAIRNHKEGSEYKIKVEVAISNHKEGSYCSTQFK